MTSEINFSKFELLLSGLSSMDDDGMVYQVYSAALEAITSESQLRLLAEALHHRWLSDSSFSQVAARLCFQLADLEAGDIRFSSIIFSLIVNDYKEKDQVRQTSAALFRNTASFSFEFYSLFDQFEPIFQSLSGNLFEYILQLINNKQTLDEDLILVHSLLCRHGEMLQKISAKRTMDVMLDIRKKVVECEMKPDIRALLLQILDLSHFSWDFEKIPQAIRSCYDQYRKNKSVSREKQQHHHQRSSRSTRSYPSVKPTALTLTRINKSQQNDDDAE